MTAAFVLNDWYPDRKQFPNYYRNWNWGHDNPELPSFHPLTRSQCRVHRLTVPVVGRYVELFYEACDGIPATVEQFENWIWGHHRKLYLNQVRIASDFIEAHGLYVPEEVLLSDIQNWLVNSIDHTTIEYKECNLPNFTSDFLDDFITLFRQRIDEGKTALNITSQHVYYPVIKGYGFYDDSFDPRLPFPRCPQEGEIVPRYLSDNVLGWYLELYRFTHTSLPPTTKHFSNFILYWCQTQHDYHRKKLAHILLQYGIKTPNWPNLQIYVDLLRHNTNMAPKRPRNQSPKLENANDFATNAPTRGRWMNGDPAGPNDNQSPVGGKAEAKELRYGQIFKQYSALTISKIADGRVVNPPPKNVRLDDNHLMIVTRWLQNGTMTPQEATERWPRDFDSVGLPRAARKSTGNPGKIYHNKEYTIAVIADSYQCRGTENQADPKMITPFPTKKGPLYSKHVQANTLIKPGTRAEKQHPVVYSEVNMQGWTSTAGELFWVTKEVAAIVRGTFPNAKFENVVDTTSPSPYLVQNAQLGPKTTTTGLPLATSTIAEPEPRYDPKSQMSQYQQDVIRGAIETVPSQPNANLLLDDNRAFTSLERAGANIPPTTRPNMTVGLNTSTFDPRAINPGAYRGQSAFAPIPGLRITSASPPIAAATPAMAFAQSARTPNFFASLAQNSPDSIDDRIAESAFRNTLSSPPRRTVNPADLDKPLSSPPIGDTFATATTSLPGQPVARPIPEPLPEQAFDAQALNIPEQTSSEPPKKTSGRVPMELKVFADPNDDREVPRAFAIAPYNLKLSMLRNFGEFDTEREWLLWALAQTLWHLIPEDDPNKNDALDPGPMLDNHDKAAKQRKESWLAYKNKADAHTAVQKEQFRLEELAKEEQARQEERNRAAAKRKRSEIDDPRLQRSRMSSADWPEVE